MRFSASLVLSHTQRQPLGLLQKPLGPDLLLWVNAAKHKQRQQRQPITARGPVGAAACSSHHVALVLPRHRPCARARCLPKSSSVSISVLVKCRRKRHQQTAADTVTSINSPGETTSPPSSVAGTCCTQGSSKTDRGPAAGGHCRGDRPTQVSQAKSSTSHKVNKSRVMGVSNSTSCSGHHPSGGMD